MSNIIHCPQCGKALNLPDKFLGKKVKCPGCATVFVAELSQTPLAPPAPPPAPAAKAKQPASEEPARGRSRSLLDEVADAPLESRGAKRTVRQDPYDDDPDDDRRRRIRRREDDDRPPRRASRFDDYDDEDDYDDGPRRGRITATDTRPLWQGVRAGLNLWVYGAWGLIALSGAGLVVLILLFLIVMVARSAEVLLFMGVIYLLLVLALLVCGIVMLVGFGMCMQAPNAPDHPTRSLAIGSFCCLLAPIVLGILIAVIAVVEPTLGAYLSLGNLFLNPALGLASLILFCLFLRSVASQARNRPLAERCMRWLVTYLITLGASFCLGLVVGILSVAFAAGAAQVGGPVRNPALAASAVGIVILLVYLGVLIWYLILFIQLIGLVGEVRDAADRLSRKK